MCKKNPLNIFTILFKFFFYGKPCVKLYVSKNYLINFKDLSFNKTCLQFINKAKKEGRNIFLISGSHIFLVKQVADYLEIFDDAYGTQNNYNMISLNKVTFINNELGIKQFDYIGNSKQDLRIWEVSNNVIYTNVNGSLLKKINLIDKNKEYIKESF